MSRFLINKGIIIKSTFLLLIVALILYYGVYWMLLLVMIVVLIKIINREILIRIQKSRARLQANREVEDVEYIILSDSRLLEKDLKSTFCTDKNYTLVLPDASMHNIFLVLEHILSVLNTDNKNVVIIFRLEREKDMVTAFDLPFYSQITKLELGINESARKFYYPLIFTPIRCFRYIFPCINPKFKESNMNNREIEILCKRHNIKVKFYQL